MRLLRHALVSIIISNTIIVAAMLIHNIRADFSTVMQVVIFNSAALTVFLLAFYLPLFKIIQVFTPMKSKFFYMAAGALVCPIPIYLLALFFREHIRPFTLQTIFSLETLPIILAYAISGAIVAGYFAKPSDR